MFELIAGVIILTLLSFMNKKINSVFDSASNDAQALYIVASLAAFMLTAFLVGKGVLSLL